MSVEGFASFLAAAEAEPVVIGVIVGGSRGKGLRTNRSDWDVYVVVDGDADLEAVGVRIAPSDPAVELCGIFGLGEFAAYGGVGTLRSGTGTRSRTSLRLSTELVGC